MRHANIGTTMNVYGGALPEEQRRANSAVVGITHGREHVDRSFQLCRCR